jgi:xylan 1,4-beta-xylosidase
LHGLGTELLEVQGRCGTVEAWAVRNDRAVTVLLTNHAMPRHPIQTREVVVRMTSAPKPRACYVERIDRDHANPRQQWQSMGKPTYPTPTQLHELECASVLRKDPQPWTFSGHDIDFTITLPPHSVAAVTFEFA